MIRENDLLDRITVRPDVFGGKPIIRDMCMIASRSARPRKVPSRNARGLAAT